MSDVPFNPIGNAVIVSASTSVYTIAIPNGMAQACFYIANLNATANAFINFVTASATAGEAVNNYPVVAYDHETFITDKNKSSFLITGATCAVVLGYYTNSNF